MKDLVFTICAFHSRARLGSEFLHRVCMGKSRYNPDYIPTVFDQTSLNIVINEEVYTINLFEVAGQADYKHLRFLSYKNTDVFVCLFNICFPNELHLLLNDDIPEMLKYRPNASIIIVGCYPEIRQRMFHKKCLSLEQLKSNCEGERPSFVTPGAARDAIQEFCIIHNFSQPYKQRITYLEYSARFSTGMNEILHTGCLMAKGMENLLKPQASRFSFRSVFAGLMGSSSKKTVPPGKGGSVLHPSQAELALLDASIIQQLDYWCGPVDEGLKTEQLEFIRSKRTIGVLASAFTLLRMLFQLHNRSTSTASVVYEWIIPTTKHAQCPFYYYLLGRRDTTQQPFVHLATHFLSHAWNSAFVLLEMGATESSLYAFYHSDPYGQNSYYWCDLFIKNQHSLAPSDQEFISAIQDTSKGGVVAILENADNPVPLSRIWCLFEYFQSIRFQQPLRFYLPTSDQTIPSTSIQVNVRDSRATVMSDKDRILKEIETLIGIDSFNSSLEEAIRQGLVIATEESSYRKTYYATTEELLSDYEIHLTSDLLQEEG